MTTTPSTTLKWTKQQDDSIAAGWGRNFSYTSGRFCIVPGEPTGWLLAVGDDHHSTWNTLREAKAMAATIAEATS